MKATLVARPARLAARPSGRPLACSPAGWLAGLLAGSLVVGWPASQPTSWPGVFLLDFVSYAAILIKSSKLTFLSAPW